MGKRREVFKTIVKKKCRLCQSKNLLTIDHIVPLSKGGTDDIENLQVLCKSCNSVKSSMKNEEFFRVAKYYENKLRLQINVSKKDWRLMKKQTLPVLLEKMKNTL